MSQSPESREYLHIADILKEGDVRGINDWTPAHMAAVRDDVGALRVLVRHGADLGLRTRIDECATPLEEARRLRRAAAVAYLESVTSR